MCSEKLNLDCLRLDGSTPLAVRQTKVDEFNDPHSTKGGKNEKKNFDLFLDIFLLSTRAGGIGLNLIGGNRLILFDPNW